MNDDPQARAQEPAHLPTESPERAVAPLSNRDDDVLAQSGLDSTSRFAASFTKLPDGFQFHQSLLGGGCLLGFFAGVLVPFLLFIYPGGFRQSGPAAMQAIAAGIAALGWLAMLIGISRQTNIIARPRHLAVETRTLGIRRTRDIPLDHRGLEVYRTSGNIMITIYGLRPAASSRGLGVALSQKEATTLKHMIEHTVTPPPAQSKIQTQNSKIEIPPASR